MAVQCTCFVIFISPSCVFCEVTWSCHVSEIYGLLVNFVTKIVSVLMIYISVENVVKFV